MQIKYIYKLQQTQAEMKEFQALWKKLKQKIIYGISLDTQVYKESVVARLRTIEHKKKSCREL